MMVERRRILVNFVFLILLLVVDFIQPFIASFYGVEPFSITTTGLLRNQERLQLQGRRLSLSSLSLKNADGCWIERVSCVERVLDVLAFRAMSGDRFGGCDAADNRGDIERFKSKVRDRIPQGSIQRFEVGGGNILQYVALMNTTRRNEDDVPAPVVFVVGAVDAKYYPSQSQAQGQKDHHHLPFSRLHVKNLKVRHGYRRRGIGTRLMEAVEKINDDDTEKKKAATAEAITLLVDEAQHQNSDAVRFYKKLGYEFLRNHLDDDDNNEPKYDQLSNDGKQREENESYMMMMVKRL